MNRNRWLVAGVVTVMAWSGMSALAGDLYVDNVQVYQDATILGKLVMRSVITNDSAALVLQANGSNGSAVFSNSASASHPFTAHGNACIRTNTSKFGCGAIQLDGNGDYLTSPGDADWNFGTADFTIDGWINPSEAPWIIRLVAGGTHVDGPWNMWFFGLGNGWSGGGETVMNFGVYDGSGYWENWWSGTPFTVVTGVWSHWALVRSGSRIYGFWNGVKVYDWDMGSVAQVNSGASGLIIGARYMATMNNLCEYVNGQMDEVRVMKGVAKWTSDFTPPSAEWCPGFTTNKPLTNTVLQVEGGIQVLGTVQAQSLQAQNLGAQAISLNGQSVSNWNQVVDATNFATAMQGAKAETALQAEADTLATVLARGCNANGSSITNLQSLALSGYLKAGYSPGSRTIDPLALGVVQSGYNVGTQTVAGVAHGSLQIGQNTRMQTIGASCGVAQMGYNTGTQTITNSHGAVQRGFNLAGLQEIGMGSFGASQNGLNLVGTQVIGRSAYGASQNGALLSGATATNNGVGAFQLFDLNGSNQTALTTADGDGSLLLGAGVASNRYAIVAGNGQASHGDGSITAGGGFYGSGSNLTGITAAQVGAVSTANVSSLIYSNASDFATASQGVKADAAWQNPASATNWAWVSDGTQITLTDYTGPNDVVIPDMLDGLPVTGFDQIFADTDIMSVSGGMNIKTVGPFAFNVCRSLTSVSLPQVTFIDMYSFSLCPALTNVSLPQVVLVGENAFFTNVSLVSVSLPHATTIGSAAFSSCPALASVTIPQATTIDVAAFSHCPALKSVAFGQSAPAEGNNIYLGSLNVTNYITEPAATGWGATWNSRPVVRVPLFGNGSNLTGLTSLQVGAAPSNHTHTAGEIGALTQEQADQRYLPAVGGVVNTLMVTNVSVSGRMTLGPGAVFYVQPQGDLSMGSFTNGPAQ